ncbi:MAG: chorismate synthase [Anaerovoracaceae bacterium]|jgi:chorismate synthase
MSNIWGKAIQISIFGESHGKGIGIVIDGLPPGEIIDMDHISLEMKRRAPGSSDLTTPRKETDHVEIISGMWKGRTTGAPLCGIISNENTRSTDYEEELARPGHADLTAYIKYGGYNDYRGGGHFSGRITAPLTFAGAIAKQLLGKKGITIGAHIMDIAGVKDRGFEGMVEAKDLKTLTQSAFPLLNNEKETPMKEAILKAKEQGDSVGGIIECAAVGLSPGIGSPFFESVESRISSMMFSIPAVKGIEFGSGFDFASMRGSQANDPFAIEEDKIVTLTNHNGGINGGITNGMPLIFRVVIKPTASIGIRQKTVNLKTMTDSEISVQGRHDPCIVIRAVPVVEAGLALCLLDLICREGWGQS